MGKCDVGKLGSVKNEKARIWEIGTLKNPTYTQSNQPNLQIP
jgi:hypothetical protein